jgi:hypothetical protein
MSKVGLPRIWVIYFCVLVYNSESSLFLMCQTIFIPHLRCYALWPNFSQVLDKDPESKLKDFSLEQVI